MSTVEVLNLKVNKFTIRAIEDVKDGDTSQTLGFHIPGVGGYLVGIYARVTEAFVGVTTPTVKVGTAGQVGLLIQKQSIDKIGNLVIGGRLNPLFCEGLSLPGGSSLDPNYQVVFESESGSLSSLTAGAVEFIILYAV